ncbi:MAG TPA: peptidylprolyl isomerase [Candidatus Binatia bacterium]|nr:peptidylprolyl isomerase [Candidatus Binatia bacterium]
MSSRNVPYLIALAALTAALGLAPLARASDAPADSAAVAAPADSTPAPAAQPAASAPADSSAPAKPESKESPAAKPEGKQASTKKSAKKTKTKAVAAAKGTVKTVETKAAPGTTPVKPDVLPQHVKVQHILIGFVGSVPGKAITRSKEEAKTLAYQILERARKGEDFDELVRKYTDDSPPGIYGMAGAGVAPGAGEYSRGGMVPAFGNVGFSISPGNIGIADYDATASPFGWHIIKRLK